MDTNELMTLAGVFFGGILIALVGYFRKSQPSASSDAVVASVGLEFGNRMQMDEMNLQLKRCADSLEVLADRKQSEMDEKLDMLLERVSARR